MRDDVGDALLSVTAAAAAKGACCAAGKVPVTTEIRLRFDVSTAVRRPILRAYGGLEIPLLFFKSLGSRDPDGGLKIRKIYKRLGMPSNPCSHDLANCRATEQR